MDSIELIENNHIFIERITSGNLQSNSYIVASNKTKTACIIDPCMPDGILKEEIRRYKFRLKCIVNTHGHIDHIEANDRFKVPVYIHREDAQFLKDATLNLSRFLLGKDKIFPEADRLLEDNDKIYLNHLYLKVIHTPGHTPGSICLYYNGFIFTGDTLFLDGIGRCDLPASSEKMLLRSICKKLLKLDDKTQVLPGHGPVTSIGRERKNNPFLQSVE